MDVDSVHCVLPTRSRRRLVVELSPRREHREHDQVDCCRHTGWCGDEPGGAVGAADAGAVKLTLAGKMPQCSQPVTPASDGVFNTFPRCG